MQKRILESSRYPKGRGPYSQAVVAGQLVFLSATGPIDPSNNKKIGGDIKRQTLQTLNNVRNLLDDAKIPIDNVVKVTVYLSNIDDYEPMNEVYRDFFSGSKPARTCVQVAALPGGDLIAVDVIAMLPN